ncbi:MAG: hypothetical protein ABIE68_03600 [bacterium]
MRRICCAMFAVLFLSLVLHSCGGNESAILEKAEVKKPVKTDEQIKAETLSLNDAFESATTDEQKVTALDNLLRLDHRLGSVAFYYLFDHSDLNSPRELGWFKNALNSSGNCESIIGAGYYIFFKISPIIKEAANLGEENGDTDDLTDEEKVKFVLLSRQAEVVCNEYNEKLGLIQEEFKIITRRNSASLFDVLRKEWSTDEGTAIELDIPLLGFLSLKEEGFEKLLMLVREDLDKTIVFAATESFGPHAVFPILKTIEYEGATPIQKNTAAICLVKLPETIEVYDKVVEACRRGHFYESKKKITDIKGMMAAVTSNWMNNLKQRYHGNTDFVNHLGQNHLSNSHGLDKVVEMMSECCLQTAYPYLEKLLNSTKPSFNSEDDKLFISLKMACNGSLLHKEDDRKTLEERFKLFYLLFQYTQPKMRESDLLIFSCKKFPPEYQEALITSLFSLMTPEERRRAIGIAEDLPQSQRNAVFDKIRPLCNSEERVLVKINYSN